MCRDMSPSGCCEQLLLLSSFPLSEISESLIIKLFKLYLSEHVASSMLKLLGSIKFIFWVNADDTEADMSSICMVLLRPKSVIFT